MNIIKRKLWLLAPFVLIITCQSQDDEFPLDTITISELRDHVYYLASNELQGRMTGTEAFLVAANYAAGQFRDAGLQPGITDIHGESTYFQQVIPEPVASQNMLASNTNQDYPGSPANLRRITQIPADNVVAIVRGTEQGLNDEYITAGAHLDHVGIRRDSIYNGADDNASGSAVILEVAEAVAMSAPKRSVIFLLYTGEEMGLLGSAYFVQHTPVPVENILVNINLDMVGRPDGIANELGVIGSDRIDPSLRTTLFEVNDRTVQMKLDTVNHNNYFRRSDQYSFYAAGIPSVLLTTGEHPDYHSPRDDPEKIDFDFLYDVSRLTYQVVMELANREP